MLPFFDQKHNTQRLKGLFKQLDPTVMKPIGDIKGEINLSFKYDFNNEMLLVKVIGCRELGNRDIRGKMSNFYVKVWYKLEKLRKHSL